MSNSLHTRSIFFAFSALTLISLIYIPSSRSPTLSTAQPAIHKNHITKTLYFPDQTMHLNAQQSIVSHNKEFLISPKVKITGSQTEPYTLTAHEGEFDTRSQTIFFPSAQIDYQTYSAKLKKAVINFEEKPNLQCHHMHIKEIK